MELVASNIVRCLKGIDEDQIEGDIYSLPDRYSKGRSPASHIHIFGGQYPELDLCSMIGVQRRVCSIKRIGFEIEKQSASLQFVDIALTKIRPYGSGFQLDKHHGKKWQDCSGALKKAVSRLIKDVRSAGSTKYAFLVAFVFTDSEKRMADLIESSIDEAFLCRYDLELTHEIWSDPYNRGIWTSVLCWRARRSETCY